VELVHYPDPILRRKAAPIAEITDEVLLRAREMVHLMHEAGGVGLAAPQVGWSVQLCVVNPAPEQRGKELVCINPVLVDSAGEQASEEGCLSFPDVKGNIVRAARLTCRYYDLEGERREVAADGLLARIFQHEIDHLNGRLIIDLMTPASRLAARGHLKELEREFKARSPQPSSA